ncbi:unnamed protein product [Pylaiella littoralis]
MVKAFFMSGGRGGGHGGWGGGGGGHGGWGGRGRGSPEMGRSGSEPGRPFGRAYRGSGAYHGSGFGYVDPSASASEVYVDAWGADGSAAGSFGSGGGGGGFIGTERLGRSSSEASAAAAGGRGEGRGMLTAVAVPAWIEGPDQVSASEAPAHRRHSSMTAPLQRRTSRGAAPTRRANSGGWIPKAPSSHSSGSGSFRSSVGLPQDMASGSARSIVEGAAEEPKPKTAEEEPVAFADASLPSPVGPPVLPTSRLLDPECPLREQGVERYVPPEAERKGQVLSSTGGPAYEPFNAFSTAFSSSAVCASVLRENRGTEERVEEVKNEPHPHPSERGEHFAAGGDAGSVPAAPSAEPHRKKKWFGPTLWFKTSSSGSSSGRRSSSGAASSAAADGDLSQSGRTKLSLASFTAASGGATAAAEEEGEGGDKKEMQGAPPPPAAAKKVSGKWAKARKAGKFVEASRILGRKRPARPRQEDVPAPSAPPAPPAADDEYSALPPKEYAVESFLASPDEPRSLPSLPPTPPPPYEEWHRCSTGKAVAASALRSFGPPAALAPAMSRSQSQSSSSSSSSSRSAAAAPGVPAGAAVGVPPSLQLSSMLPTRTTFASPRTSTTFASHRPRGASAAVVGAASALPPPPRALEATLRSRRVVEFPFALQHHAPAAAGPASGFRSLGLTGATRDRGSDDNGYDTGMALFGRCGADDTEEESEVSGSLAGSQAAQETGYSAMPQDRLDGGSGFNGNTKKKFVSLYPEIQRRPHLEPSDSEVTTASDKNNTNGNNSSRYINIPPPEDSKRAMSNVPRSTAYPGGGRRPYRRDPVIFSCFAPPGVRPGDRFDLKVRAYLRHMRDAALREATANGAAEAGRPGGMRIGRGKRVTVELVLPEHAFTVVSPDSMGPNAASVDRPALRDFVWTGDDKQGQEVKFRVACKEGVALGRVQCEARVVEGKTVTLLSFGIEVVGPGVAPRVLDGGDDVELDTIVEEVRGNMAMVPFEELNFVCELGKGIQGQTSHYTWRGKDVAVKSLVSYPAFDPSKSLARSGLEHEATILSLLSVLGNTSNIVEFYGLSQQGGSCGGGDEGYHLVTKLEKGGSIEDALGVRGRGDSEGNGNGYPGGGGRYAPANGGAAKGGWRGENNGHGWEYDGNVRAAWARDIARGLANSHAAGVLHNDVASRNALLSARGPGGRGLLCDFGLSRFMPEEGGEKAFLIDAEGSEDLWPVQRMPPEALAHPYPLTLESDAWMYGLFLYEVFEGRPPWAGIAKSEVKRLVLEGRKLPAAPEMLRDRGQNLVKLYEACLSAESAKRPSMENVVDELTSNVYCCWTPSSSSMHANW